MASLTGQLVAETYKALLKTIDNDILTASEKQITDGFGGGSNVFIDSQGFLRANKYKVTNGLATQFLKADGSLDSNTYLTGITSSQIISALGYTPVPTTRTLTINGTTYDLSANRSWTIDGTSAVWGNISGTLSNQTDLQNALNAKYNNPTGTISQYIRGDGSLATFPAITGFVPYTGATANVDLGEFALSAEYLAIDTDTTHSTDVGEIVWNPIDGTFDMGLLNGVVLQAGQELHFYGKASGAIGNGKAVMFAGVEGDHLLMSLADPATINANPQYFIGVATQDFANNDFGYVTILGKVRNLDTTAFTLGSVLYFDSANATDGLLTETQPIAPNAKIEVAAVVRVHATQGTLMVRPHIMPKMSMIQDVYIADPANNHGLFYDLANGYWENKSIASALGYTPQSQLDGTGFVKASGTTITYDNSTYLTTTDAASTYQRLDKMVSNLLASATEYPNSNAVINALALKADALNPVFTGYMTISGAEPKLYFTDTDQNPDYFIGADAGFFRIYDQTAGTTRFVINSSGVTTIAGDLIVGTIAKSGGTATQFLKADGSIDSSTYVTSASLANYLLITTAASTYQRLDKMVSNLLASDTEYPNSNAVLAKLALKADAANPVFTGDMTISGIAPKLYFTDTDNNPDYTLFVDSGYFYIYDQTAGATKFQITPSGNAINTGTFTSASFIKSGGTSSQYLMADGSVSTFSGVIGSGTTNYLPKWTSGSALGNSVIYDNGTNIAIRSTNAYSPLNVQGYGIAWGENVTYFASSSGYITLAFWLQGANDYTGTWAIGKQSRTVEASVEYLQVAKNGLTGGTLHRADALQTWDPNGNSYFGFRVGVGTITPSAKLSLGTGVGVKLLVYDNPTLGVYSGLGQDLAAGDSIDLFAHGYSNLGFITFGQLSTNKTTYTEWARFRTNGWFGIGTTSPDARLHVQSPTVSYGQIRFLNSSADGEATIHIGRTNQTLEQRWTFGQGPAGIGDNFGFYTNGSNKFTLTTSGAGTFLSSITATNGIFNFTKSGSGIESQNLLNLRLYGTNAIGDQLNIRFQSNSGQEIAFISGILGADNVAYGSIGFSARNYWTDSVVEVMRITNRGDVCIGSTSSPYNSPNRGSLFVNGASNSLIGWGVGGSAKGYLYHEGTNVYLENSVSGGAFNIVQVGAGSTVFTNNGAERMRMNPVGNLGIGTSNPSARLSLGTGIGAKLLVYDNSSNVFSGLGQDLAAGNSTDFFAHGAGGGFLTFGMLGTNKTTYTEWMRINTSGNVGIGTTNPLQALGATLTVQGTLLSNPAASGGNYNENVRANRAGNGYSAIAMGGAYGSTAGTGTGVWTLVATPAGVSYAFDFDYAGGTVIRISTGGNITATAFFESSDMRLKKLIDGSAQIENIENLEAKLYEKNGKLEFGYFAQDAEKLMPFAVDKNADGFLTLSYREIHTAKIARLEKRVAELEKQLNLN